MAPLSEGLVVRPGAAQDAGPVRRQARLREAADARQLRSGVRVRVELIAATNEPQEADSVHRLDAHQGSLPHAEVEFHIRDHSDCHVDFLPMTKSHIGKLDTVL